MTLCSKTITKLWPIRIAIYVQRKNKQTFEKIIREFSLIMSFNSFIYLINGRHGLYEILELYGYNTIDKGVHLLKIINKNKKSLKLYT